MKKLSFKKRLALIICIHLGAILCVSLAHAKKPKDIVAYDFEGEKFTIKNKLPKVRCKRAFIYEAHVQKWIEKCEKEGGKLIYPDTCSPRVWCTKNVKQICSLNAY